MPPSLLFFSSLLAFLRTQESINSTPQRDSGFRRNDDREELSVVVIKKFNALFIFLDSIGLITYKEQMMNENNPPPHTNEPKPQPRKRYNPNLPTPKEVTTFIDQRRAEERLKKLPFSINEFLAEMPTVDLTNPLELHGMMEQQANLLNQTFHYIVLDNRLENFDLAFKAQKLIRDTLPIIERYAGCHIDSFPDSAFTRTTKTDDSIPPETPSETT